MSTLPFRKFTDYCTLVKGFIPLMGLFLFIFFSCTENKFKIPADLIPRQEMKGIFMDIYLAEAYSNLTFDNRNRDNTMLTRYKEAELFIFKKYKISPKRFESSMEYYLYHDPDLNKLYDEMYLEFSEKRKKILKDSENFRKKDSLLHPEKKIRADRMRDSLNAVIKKNTAKIKHRDSLLKIYPKLNPSFRSKSKKRSKISKPKSNKPLP